MCWMYILGHGVPLHKGQCALGSRRTASFGPRPNWLTGREAFSRATWRCSSKATNEPKKQAKPHGIARGQLSCVGCDHQGDPAQDRRD